MTISLNGATRLNVIVGDPIAQVKSPAAMTRSFLARGVDAVLVPAQVAAEDLTLFLDAATKMKNLDGIIVTTPHKFACAAYCRSKSARSDFLGAVNVMRRENGGWHGDIVDGVGFVGAARRHGVEPAGKTALLVGAGGAGSAIALALIEAGVAELAVHDTDHARRDRLIERLGGLGKGRVGAGSSDPDGYDLVCNASPAGMGDGDPLPVDVGKLKPSQYVGCVITSSPVSPLVAEAAARGCVTGAWSDMYAALQEPMLDFLLFADREVAP